MESKKLHPSVEQFKEFIKTHPELIKKVRNEEYTWQELYEDWYLLGADDPKWENYKANVTEKKSETNKQWMNQLTGIIKNMDVNQVQHHIQQLSQAIGAIQGVLGQFQGSESNNAQKPSMNNHPFSFRKD